MSTPLFTSSPQQQSVKFATEFTAPLGDVLGAEAEQSWIFSPLDSLMRWYELNAVSGQTRLKPEFEKLPQAERLKAERDPASFELVPSGRLSFREQVTQDQILSQEQAMARVKEAGVPLTVPPSGITREALEILINRKQEELERQNILLRAEDSFLTGAARLGVGFGVTILDPINVASAFIPVVGPARYSAMLAQRTSAGSRAALRARVGAAEGAVGAAVVEPLILSAAHAEQADYDLSDSLLNIAFGTILGGGLHAGGGAAMDAVKRQLSRVDNQGSAADALSQVDIDTKEGFTRSALSQIATDRHIDLTVAGAFTPVRAVERRTLIPGEQPQQITPDVESIARELDPVLMRRFDDLQTRKDFLRTTLDDLEGPREQRAQDQLADLDATIAGKESQLERVGARARKRINKELEVLRAQREEQPQALRTVDTPDTRRVRNELESVDKKQRDMAEDVTAVYQQARERADNFNGQRAPVEPEYRVETVFERDRTPGIGAEIERTFNAQAQRFADFEASAEIDEFIAARAETDDVVAAANLELEDALDQLTELKARGLDVDDDLGVEDDLVTLAEEQGKGVEALALCGRRG